MKVNIVHPSLNRLGGAEKVALEMIGALTETGHEIRLMTLDETDWAGLERSVGNASRPNDETYVFKKMPSLDSKHNWGLITLAYLVLLNKARIGRGVSINNYGEVFPILTDISFIHSIPLYAETNQADGNAYGTPSWNIASNIYRLILASHLSWGISRLLVTNSGYNSRIVEKTLGVIPMVLYPPATSDPMRRGFRAKENVIVTVSRFSKEKRLELIPRIAKRTSRNYHFLILGGLDQRSTGVVERIVSDSKELEVYDRVHIVENPCSEEVDKAYEKASVYLSTQSTEAFGIAVVEAMASGCVPVVPRNGGPWHDILSGRQGKYGYSYENAAEAAEWIDLVLSEPRMREDIQGRNEKRAERFDSRHFRERFVNLVESMT